MSDRFKQFDADTREELIEQFDVLQQDNYGRLVIENPLTLAASIQERFLLIPKDQIPEVTLDPDSHTTIPCVNASKKWHLETRAIAERGDRRTHAMRKVLISLARITWDDERRNRRETF